MDKYTKVVFSHKDFLMNMEVGEERFADLRFVNIGSLKSMASQLRKAGHGKWKVSESGKVIREE